MKTTKFAKPNYIGDPINAVKIYNEKEVDELIFLDITATIENREPDYSLIEDIAKECFMPFAYGGGIRSIDSIHKLLRLGVEKVVLNSAAKEDPELVREAVRRFGSSTIIASIDLKKGLFSGYSRCTRSGKQQFKCDPVQVCKDLEALGVGELFVNSVDRDGTMSGYDLEILRKIAQNVNVPVIACGGAGSLNDVKNVVEQCNVAAAAAGSIFVYHGDIKGILINYPRREELDRLFL